MWRTGQSDLDGVEPFRLADATLPDTNSDRSALMIAVAGVRIDGADELVVLAASGEARGARREISSDEIVDPPARDGWTRRLKNSLGRSFRLGQTTRRGLRSHVGSDAARRSCVNERSS